MDHLRNVILRYWAPSSGWRGQSPDKSLVASNPTVDPG